MNTLAWHRPETGYYEAKPSGAAHYTIRRGSAPSGYYGAWSVYRNGRLMDRPGTLREAKATAQREWDRFLAQGERK